MASGRFVSYLRVSTDKQGRSKLGLEAQREAVASYLNGGAWTLLADYVETESGKKNDRAQLAKALEHCRLTGATLVVAKLDRLARDQHFLMTIYNGSSEGGVVFCDLPNLPAGPVGKFMVQQMAAVAELEAGLISARTKAALAAAKARGKDLGGFRGYVPNSAAGAAAARAKADAFAASVGPMVQEMRYQGLSLSKIAAALTEQGIRTARGGAWTPTSVRNLLARQTA